MHVTTPEITGLLKKLLIKIAVSHPQSIVCPILVSYNTADAHQKAVAAAVIQDMRLKHNTLVDEATMVSNELMRVAITPHELWNDGLEKAAKYYVTDRNLSGMMSVLVDLHKSLDLSGEERESADGFIEGISKVGFTTLRDVSFRHSYSRDLAEAYEFLMKFNRTARTTDLHQAWDLYHKVFKRISAQLKTFKNVHLNHVLHTPTTNTPVVYLHIMECF
jgi:FKBP12-rapamycin complex-associated protein